MSNAQTSLTCAASGAFVALAWCDSLISVPGWKPWNAEPLANDAPICTQVFVLRVLTLQGNHFMMRLTTLAKQRQGLTDVRIMLDSLDNFPGVAFQLNVLRSGSRLIEPQLLKACRAWPLSARLATPEGYTPNFSKGILEGCLWISRHNEAEWTKQTGHETDCSKILRVKWPVNHTHAQRPLFLPFSSWQASPSLAGIDRHSLALDCVFDCTLG